MMSGLCDELWPNNWSFGGGVKHMIVQVQNPPYLSDLQLHVIYFCYLNWKYIWTVKFEDVEDIKQNTIMPIDTNEKRILVVFRSMKNGLEWKN